MKTLLFLGASRYQIQQIEIARSLGCRVVAVDGNADAGGLVHADAWAVANLRDPSAVLRIAREHSVDAVLAINDSGVEAASEVAVELGLPGIRREAARRATSKALMREAWDAAGIPSARFRVASHFSEATAAVREMATWPLVVKPANSRGGSSRGVSVIDAEAELAEAYRFAQAFYPGEDIVLEEFLDGLEHSAEIVVRDGKCSVVAVSDKVKTPLPYRVDRSVTYPTRLGAVERGALENTMCAAVQALGIDYGVAHVEACTTADGPRLFELGARCGGGATPHLIVPHATGVQLFHTAVRLALGEDPGGLTATHDHGCAYHFLMPAPGVLKRVEGIDEVRRWPGILDAEVTVPVGSAIKPVRVGQDRAGFVVAGGATSEAALDLAHRAERHIQIIVSDG